MSFQPVNFAYALSPGCDLWILSNNWSQDLLKEIDWLLNLQLSKSELHKAQELPPQVKDIVRENQIPNVINEPDQVAPLMVLASPYLPAKTVIQIRGRQQKSEWVEYVHNVWQGLNHPKLRVFLPPGITLEEFKNSWPGPKGDSISIVIPK